MRPRIVLRVHVFQAERPGRGHLGDIFTGLGPVESWFHVFDGEPTEYIFCTKERPDADIENPDPQRADEDLAIYRASVERSRAAVTGRSLDDLIPGSGKPTSLRGAYQHMIEEYARHNGLADLVRESLGLHGGWVAGGWRDGRGSG